MTSRRRRRLLALAPLVLVLSACADNAPQDYLEPEGKYARDIDRLFDPVMLVAAVVFVFVEFGALYVAFRFRRRHDDDDSVLPAQTHGNTRLELGWTIVPALILAVVALFTLVTLGRVSDQPDDAMTVDVYGQQWWWAYEYDTDGDGEPEIVTANDLVIPAGDPVNLRIHSRDVIHSFWAPKLNGKKDAVPGRVHPLTLQSDGPGTFVGQCTEFCGLSHAYMRIRVIALPEAEFQAWLADQAEAATTPTEGSAAAGAKLFRERCSSCHLARGVNDDVYAGRAEQVSGIAPDLTHFASRGSYAGAIFDLWRDTDGDEVVEIEELGQDLDRATLEAWLRNPPEAKPMAADRQRGMPDLGLTEQEIDQLVDLLLTLL